MKASKVVLWNTKKVSGWEAYKGLTESDKEFNKFATHQIEDPTEAQKQLDKLITKSKFKAFGKVSITKNVVKDDSTKELEMLFMEKENSLRLKMILVK